MTCLQSGSLNRALIVLLLANKRLSRKFNRNYSGIFKCQTMQSCDWLTRMASIINCQPKGYNYRLCLSSIGTVPTNRSLGSKIPRLDAKESVTGFSDWKRFKSWLELVCDVTSIGKNNSHEGHRIIDFLQRCQSRNPNMNILMN